MPQRFRGSTCQVTTPTSLAVESAQGKKLFVFDRVFGEDVDQEGIWEYLSESVNSFVQGYNVSILAYGQSGAGKSYTMGTTGPREQADSRIMGMLICQSRAHLCLPSLAVNTVVYIRIVAVADSHFQALFLEQHHCYSKNSLALRAIVHQALRFALHQDIRHMVFLLSRAFQNLPGIRIGK